MKKKRRTKPTTSKAKKPPIRPTQAAEATPSLTIRQKRSCDIYHAMKKPNKTKACRLAGFTMGGKHAKTEAQKTFNLPHVKAYLNSLKEAATEKAQKTADEIIAEMEKLSFTNIADYLDVDEDGEVRIKAFEQIDRDKLAAVKSVKVSMTKNKKGDREYQTTTFELYDKKGALELLGKRHGLFPNRQEFHVTGEVILKPPMVK